MTNNPLKNNLIQSYNNHAEERDTYTMDAWKIEERENFLKLLQSKIKGHCLRSELEPAGTANFFRIMG